MHIVKNSAGESVPVRELTATEKERLVFLSCLEWPGDKDVLGHLSADSYRAWIYGMAPRDALLLSCNPRFQDWQQGQRIKGRIRRAWDWLWRVYHDVNF